MSADGLPIPTHLAGEFYAWLWFTSEQQGGSFDLPAPVGKVDVWVDERLAFRNPDDQKVAAVMTGDSPATTLEARAALAGGKVLHDLRIGVRRDDREFVVTLRGPGMQMGGLKLPQVVLDGGEEVLFDRMHLYDELCLVVAGLFRSFARVRTGDAWSGSVLPALQAWIAGRV